MLLCSAARARASRLHGDPSTRAHNNDVTQRSLFNKHVIQVFVHFVCLWFNTISEKLTLQTKQTQTTPTVKHGGRGG